jgi:hypothetical protein
MTQIERADPTSKALQNLITTAVIERVADHAIYSIPFKNSAPVKGISAKGAEELYQQCVMQNLCPEMALEKTNDHVVDNVWICDGVWRATWRKTGETYTIDARGSQPNNDANANRVAFGKAKRNAHLSAVPSVIREAFMDHLTKHYGNRVVDNEEYVERLDRNPASKSPSTTARATGRRKATEPSAETSSSASAGFQLVYAHIATKWGKVPADSLQDLYTALGDCTLPEYLESHTKEEAVARIDNFYQNGGSTEPTVVTAVEAVEADEGEQAPLVEGE